MTHRDRLKTIFAGQTADRTGFWLGKPDDESWPALLRHFGAESPEALRRQVGDEYAWVMAGAYRHPDGLPAFPRGNTAVHGLGVAGPLADYETVAEIEAFPWPDPAYLDFTETLAAVRASGDVYRAGGMWSTVFDTLRNLFGFEECLVKMHTHPAVIEAAVAHITDFYYEGNRHFFSQAGPALDGFFFGNDMGTQLDLLISPESFRRFLLPNFRRLIDLAHGCGYQVILHSCGAVSKIIPDLIDAGVEALHPLQAKAAGMDTESLAREYKGRIAFLGGIDTQELLVHGTPAAVRAEVRRMRDLLGPSLVVSPSHETILPNIPPANVQAMAEAATA
jgi:uroporphyrinogen decarboxylase